MTSSNLLSLYANVPAFAGSAFTTALPAPSATALLQSRRPPLQRPRRVVHQRGLPNVCARVAAPHSDAPAADDGLEDPRGSSDHRLTPDGDLDLPEWEGLVSDDTHVVVDGSEIAHLIDELRRTGADELGSTALADDASDNSSDTAGMPSVDMALLNLAEKRSDERQGRVEGAVAPPPSGGAAVEGKEEEEEEAVASSVSANEVADATPSSAAAAPAAVQELKEGDDGDDGDEGDEASKTTEGKRSAGLMQYFADENVGLMPSWAREMYDNHTHDELERGASVLVPKTSRERLHEIVADGASAGGAGSSGIPLSERDDGMHEVGADAEAGDDRTPDMRHAGRGTGAGGLVDCRVRDVAEDYGVPEELVVDALLSFGVAKPVTGGTSVRDSMSGDEIVRLLRLITSFDAVDLADRYSDRTIAELADDYDLDAADVLAVCEREGLYVHAGAQTRLSVVREDSVLDILLKGAPFGKPYPSPLDGLE